MNEDALSPALRDRRPRPRTSNCAGSSWRIPIRCSTSSVKCDPVHWSPELEAWVVTRFELVRESLRAPELVNDRTAINMRAIHEPLRPNYRSLRCTYRTGSGLRTRLNMCGCGTSPAISSPRPGPNSNYLLSRSFCNTR